jgi:hypothetical protein
VFRVEDLVAESDAHDFETLKNRRQGLSRNPLSKPIWVATWIPVHGRTQGLTRVVYRSTSSDFLTWLNALERASDAERERMWEDPAVLRRMTRPGVIEGHVERIDREGLGRAFGSRVSGVLFAVEPGPMPPAEVPMAALFSGIASLGVLFLVFRARAAPAPVPRRCSTAPTSRT